MKTLTVQWSVLAACAFGMTPGLASQPIAQKNQCMTCHAVATKVLGPAYQDVAKKYKGSKDAEAALVASIKKGSAGKWGAIPMPAQSAVSDADSTALAKWILGLAK